MTLLRLLPARAAAFPDAPDIEPIPTAQAWQRTGHGHRLEIDLRPADLFFLESWAQPTAQALGVSLKPAAYRRLLMQTGILAHGHWLAAGAPVERGNGLVVPCLSLGGDR